MTKKNFRGPPDDKALIELIHYIWDHGLGNHLSDVGDSNPWIAESLEAAFLEFGYTIDSRTLENWHSGSTAPSAKNLRALARVIARDENQRMAWLDALLEARRTAVEKRAAKNSAPEEYEQTKPVDTDQPSTSADGVNRGSAKMKVALALVGSAALVMIAYVVATSPADRDVRATNIRFCDAAHFSREEKVCTESIEHFPVGIVTIYTSFDLENAHEGQRFERRWYRYGRLYAQRESMNIAPWEGWTWLRNPNMHKEGEYHMNVIIDGNVTSGSFTIGQTTTEDRFRLSE